MKVEDEEVPRRKLNSKLAASDSRGDWQIKVRVLNSDTGPGL